MYRILLASLFLSCGPAIAADIEHGEQVFRKCQTCHMVGEDAKVRVGPPLNGLFGRQAGTLEEYRGKYSRSMVEAGEAGLIWNEETLSQYLIKPGAMIKRTKMAFPGLPKEEDRADVIAYLKQFNEETGGSTH